MNQTTQPAPTKAKELPPDELAFGVDAFVYCRQHLKPHTTGWCGVSPSDKVGLGVDNIKDAIYKCREWGFVIYND